MVSRRSTDFKAGQTDFKAGQTAKRYPRAASFAVFLISTTSAYAINVPRVEVPRVNVPRPQIEVPRMHVPAPRVDIPHLNTSHITPHIHESNHNSEAGSSHQGSHFGGTTTVKAGTTNSPVNTSTNNNSSNNLPVNGVATFGGNGASGQASNTLASNGSFVSLTPKPHGAVFVTFSMKAGGSSPGTSQSTPAVNASVPSNAPTEGGAGGSVSTTGVQSLNVPAAGGSSTGSGQSPGTGGHDLEAVNASAGGGSSSSGSVGGSVAVAAGQSAGTGGHDLEAVNASAGGGSTSSGSVGGSVAAAAGQSTGAGGHDLEAVNSSAGGGSSSSGSVGGSVSVAAGQSVGTGGHALAVVNTPSTAGSSSASTGGSASSTSKSLPSLCAATLGCASAPPQAATPPTTPTPSSNSTTIAITETLCAPVSQPGSGANSGSGLLAGLGGLVIEISQNSWDPSNVLPDGTLVPTSNSQPDPPIMTWQGNPPIAYDNPGADANPLYGPPAPNQQPLYNGDGTPVGINAVPAQPGQGVPLLDSNGNQLYDANGNPFYVNPQNPNQAYAQLSPQAVPTPLYVDGNPLGIGVQQAPPGQGVPLMQGQTPVTDQNGNPVYVTAQNQNQSYAQLNANGSISFPQQVAQAPQYTAAPANGVQTWNGGQLQPQQYGPPAPATNIGNGPNPFAGLADNQIANIPPQQFQNLTPQQVGNIPGTQYSNLTPYQIQNIPPAAMPNVNVGALDAQQVASLTPQQLANIPPSQMPNLNVTMLTPDQVASLTPQQFNSLGSQNFQTLTPYQLQNIPSQQIPQIATAQSAQPGQFPAVATAQSAQPGQWSAAGSSAAAGGSAASGTEPSGANVNNSYYAGGSPSNGIGSAGNTSAGNAIGSGANSGAASPGSQNINNGTYVQNQNPNLNLTNGPLQAQTQQAVVADNTANTNGTASPATTTSPGAGATPSSGTSGNQALTNSNTQTTPAPAPPPVVATTPVDQSNPNTVVGGANVAGSPTKLAGIVTNGAVKQNSVPTTAAGTGSAKLTGNATVNAANPSQANAQPPAKTPSGSASGSQVTTSGNAQTTSTPAPTPVVTTTPVDQSNPNTLIGSAGVAGSSTSGKMLAGKAQVVVLQQTGTNSQQTGVSLQQSSSGSQQTSTSPQQGSGTPQTVILQGGVQMNVVKQNAPPQPPASAPLPSPRITMTTTITQSDATNKGAQSYTAGQAQDPDAFTTSALYEAQHQAADIRQDAKNTLRGMIDFLRRTWTGGADKKYQAIDDLTMLAAELKEGKKISQAQIHLRLNKAQEKFDEGDKEGQTYLHDVANVPRGILEGIESDAQKAVALWDRGTKMIAEVPRNAPEDVKQSSYGQATVLMGAAMYWTAKAAVDVDAAVKTFKEPGVNSDRTIPEEPVTAETTPQITASRDIHERALDDFIAKAKLNGMELVSRDGITVRTPFGPRRYDAVFRDPATGTLHGVEIKSSPGAFRRFDRLQYNADRWVNEHGAEIIGANAGRIETAIKIQWQAPSPSSTKLQGFVGEEGRSNPEMTKGVTTGTDVSRNFGGESDVFGKSWTTDPLNIQSRNGLGLETSNTGEFIAHGTVVNATGISTHPAYEWGRFGGGLQETEVPRGAVRANAVTMPDDPLPWYLKTDPRPLTGKPVPKDLINAQGPYQPWGTWTKDPQTGAYSLKAILPPGLSANELGRLSASPLDSP
jgi:hypothetical protein